MLLDQGECFLQFRRLQGVSCHFQCEQLDFRKTATLHDMNVPWFMFVGVEKELEPIFCQ